MDDWEYSLSSDEVDYIVKCLKFRKKKSRIEKELTVSILKELHWYEEEKENEN